MAVHPLAVAVLGCLDRLPADGVRRRCAVLRRDLERGDVEHGGFVEQRPSDVDVVEHHVSGILEPLVANHIGESQRCSTQVSAPGALKHEVLAEDARLAHEPGDHEVRTTDG